MKSNRLGLTLFAAALGVSALIGSALVSPASAGKWDWLGNKPYLDCLRLTEGMSHGGVWRADGRRISGAEQAARADQGRRHCNRKFYGHD